MKGGGKGILVIIENRSERVYLSKNQNHLSAPMNLLGPLNEIRRF